jgi:hypothetical protein
VHNLRDGRISGWQASVGSAGEHVRDPTCCVNQLVQLEELQLISYNSYSCNSYSFVSKACDCCAWLRSDSNHDPVMEQEKKEKRLDSVEHYVETRRHLF